MRESIGILKNYEKICFALFFVMIIFSFIHYFFDYSVGQGEFYVGKFLNLSLISLFYLLFYAIYYFNIGDRKVHEVWSFYETAADSGFKLLWMNQKYLILPVIILFVLKILSLEKNGMWTEGTWDIKVMEDNVINEVLSKP